MNNHTNPSLERARQEYHAFSAGLISSDRLFDHLAKLEANERLTKCRTASVYTNVVLALHQQAGRAQIDLLRKLLDMPPFIYPKGDPQ